MRSWLSVYLTDAKSKKKDDIPIAPSLYSLSNKMDNSLLAVRDINHIYIVVEKVYAFVNAVENKKQQQKSKQKILAKIAESIYNMYVDSLSCQNGSVGRATHS